MGLIYKISVRLVNFLVFFFIVVLLPGLPPRTTFPFKEFEHAPIKELKGALEPNFHLDGAERLLEGRLYGPECLIARKNEIFTGIYGGEIVKITGDHITFVAKIGQPCEEAFEEARCGRPLGLAFDTLGNNLIVSDAYYGIWEVNLSNGHKKLLVSPQQELEGKTINRAAKFFNGLTIDKQGDIYWTDSNSDFLLQDLAFATFANPSGRLFKYDRKKNVSKVLLDELHFANGLALSPDEEFIVVTESGAGRLGKYYLKGPKAGQSDIFVDGLPGMPDNLTPDAEGLWVPLIVSADNEHPSLYQVFSRFPSVRKFLVRFMALAELPFRLLNDVYPNKFSQRIVHLIGQGEAAKLFYPERATVVRLDWHGNIVGSLHGTDGSVGSISHVLEFNDKLYLGSPWNRYIARIKSPKAGKQAGVHIRNVRYEGDLEASAKPAGTRATAKPASYTTTTTTTSTTTTTTPKPTTTRTTPKATTTTTTPKPITTTTRKPTTTTTTTTTTPKPTTTTVKPTTSKPLSTQKPIVTTPKQQPTKATPTTTAKPTKRVPPKQPAPIEEALPSDSQPPKVEKLKVINKEGKHVEL